MGSKDLPKKEKKKPGKQARKAPPISLTGPVEPVEVIKVKGRKSEEG